MIPLTRKEALDRVRELVKMNRRIAIHAVLEDIFVAALRAGGGLWVELGVSKEALANKVLVEAARQLEPRPWLLSCDLGEFGWVCNYDRWLFHRGDDVDLAERLDRIVASSINRDGIVLPARVDLLLIDTDELYEHVCREIDAWFPWLSDGATVMFRCTNLQKRLYYADGTVTNLGWDNDRGVIRALGDRLGVSFDETRIHSGRHGGWSVQHVPWGAGLTVLTREGRLAA